MGAKDLRRERAVRRICESIATTVLGGVILWSVTGSMSQPTLTTERTAVAIAPAIQPAPVPFVACGDSVTGNTGSSGPIGKSEAAFSAPNTGINISPSLATSTTSEAPTARVLAIVPIQASIPKPPLAAPPPKRDLQPFSIPVGSILWYENFAGYKEGDATGWGPNASIKKGLDRRNWLASNADGAHPVGCRIRLPNEFYFECRYSAYLPEVTRGVLGFWKEPVATKISFQSDKGAKYTIDWVVKCANDPTRLNPLGSSSLCAKKYYHTVNLPDGTANEVGVIQPTGMLRIERDKNAVKVLVDGQSVVVGTMNTAGQLVGFEIDVVKATNGALFFTDFKIGR